MKKLLILLISSVLFTGNINAKTLDDLAQLFASQTQSGDYSGAMDTSTEVVDALIKKGDINNAGRFSDQLIQATHPSIAKHGYFLKSVVLHTAYKATNDKSFLVKSGASLLNASKSEEAIALSALLAKDYGGNPEVFAKKLKHEMDLQAIDRTLSAVYKHLQYGRWELVKSYLEKKIISVNEQLSSDGTTLLHMAVWFNKNSEAKELVTLFGANVNIIDEEGDSPLGYAKHKKNGEMIRFLKSQGGR